MDKINSILQLPKDDQNRASLELMGLNVNDQNSIVFVLGEKFDISSEAFKLLQYIYGLTRMTYRTNFESLRGICSDLGWGCMMRTGQAALMNACVKLFLPSDFHVIRGKAIEQYRTILSYFGDTFEAPLSIQNIALTGEELDVQVGKWFGPTTICHVLKRLVAKSPLASKLKIYVAQDSVISEDEIKECSASFTVPVILLIPLRLGLHSTDPQLLQKIFETLKWPQSAGVLGGKPRTSYLFVGSEGENLLYLDPHFAQATINMNESNFPLDSFHSYGLSFMKGTDIDPSLALAFIIKNQNDFLELKTRVEKNGVCFGLFSFQKTNYEYNETKKSNELNEDDDDENGNDWNLV